MLRALLRLVGWRRGAQAWKTDSGSPPRGVRNDETGEHGVPQPLVILGLPEGQNPGSVSNARDDGATDLEVTNGKAGVDAPAATRIALIVSATWMLLPINLMAVLYVVQRMESLCQVFVLAGLWVYLHGRWMMLTAESARRDRWGLALAVSGIVLGTVLGLTSKETAVLLPVFAFLAEWILLKFSRSALHPSPTGRGAGGEGTGLVISPTETEPSPAPPGHPLPKGEGKSRTDTRIWTLFTVTLFIPAVLGFLWLLRSALRPGALAGRNFTLAQRLLTEPRVLVDYLHWTLLPDPMVWSLYHDRSEERV